MEGASTEASKLASSVLMRLTGAAGPADASPTLVVHMDAVHRLGGALTGLTSLTGLPPYTHATAGNRRFS